MPSFDQSSFAKLARLCHLSYKEEEKDSYIASLNSILDYMKKLDEVETQGVLPCTHAFDVLHNAMREDEVRDLLPREVFLKNIPHIAGLVRVPPILK